MPSRGHNRALRSYCELYSIRRGYVRQLTVLGDGAAWNIAAAKFPAAQVADLYHAREHLHDLACRLEFMLLDRKDEWLAARLEDLDHGHIDGITSATRKYPSKALNRQSSTALLNHVLSCRNYYSSR